MTIEEMVKNGMLILPRYFNRCPKCQHPMIHGFRINSYQCTNCEYNEEFPNIDESGIYSIEKTMKGETIL